MLQNRHKYANGPEPLESDCRPANHVVASNERQYWDYSKEIFLDLHCWGRIDEKSSNFQSFNNSFIKPRHFQQRRHTTRKRIGSHPRPIAPSRQKRWNWKKNLSAGEIRNPKTANTFIWKATETRKPFNEFNEFNNHLKQRRCITRLFMPFSHEKCFLRASLAVSQGYSRTTHAV